MISAVQKGPYPSTHYRAAKVHPNRLRVGNVALGAMHWRNVDRSLATCGGQFALKAINATPDCPHYGTRLPNKFDLQYL